MSRFVSTPPHVLVVFHMLGRDVTLGVDAPILFQLEIGDLGGEVLGFDENRGQEIGERTFVWYIQADFHLSGCVSAE